MDSLRNSIHFIAFICGCFYMTAFEVQLLLVKPDWVCYSNVEGGIFTAGRQFARSDAL